ncbi:MAG: hypothetical protein AAF705_21905, partial [Bacteroidota bacterium]
MRSYYFKYIMSLGFFLGLFVSTTNLSAQGWVQIGSGILGDQANSSLGRVVEISKDGRIIAVATERYDTSAGTDVGIVKVYENLAGVWTQIGSDLYGNAANDRFGFSVSLSTNGNILAVGQPTNTSNGIGQIRIFENQNGTWVGIGTIIGSGNTPSIGDAVALSSDGKRVVISDSNSGAGFVFVYEQDTSGNWNQIGNTMAGNSSADFFGRSVDISNDGSVIAIGIHRSDITNTDAGLARVFKYDGQSWNKVGNDIEGLGGMTDFFGTAIALSGDGSIVIVGASFGDFNAVFNSGYVMTFAEESGVWNQLGTTLNGTFLRERFGESVDIN